VFSFALMFANGWLIACDVLWCFCLLAESYETTNHYHFKLQVDGRMRSCSMDLVHIRVLLNWGKHLCDIDFVWPCDFIRVGHLHRSVLKFGGYITILNMNFQKFSQTYQLFRMTHVEL